MLINLKTHATNTKPGNIHANINDRIPANIKGPCSLNCNFSVSAMNDYFLLNLDVQAELIIICQRCVSEFPYHYENKTTLAICHSDARAEELANDYECIVSQHGEVDLIELLTDELHLYTPEFHSDFNDCDREIGRFIGSNKASS